MLTRNDMIGLAPHLLRLAVEAGDEILAVYESDDFQTERKADDSPLTLADRKSHLVIDAGLRRLAPQVPILSEEGRHDAYSERAGWDELWLVDPLDGTKEFLKRNGEFTVNIALIQRGAPVMGVIFAPVRKEAWVGIDGAGAWKLHLGAPGEVDTDRPVAGQGTAIRVRERHGGRIAIIASRTHLNDETEEFIHQVVHNIPQVEIVNVGSSLKLCYIAEGRADIYPRYAPTSEWDTAAGHAIVRAAGGEIFQAGQDADEEPVANVEARLDVEPAGHGPLPLRYNKENLLNPWFVVRAW